MKHVVAIAELLRDGMSVKQVVNRLNVGKSHVYRVADVLAIPLEKRRVDEEALILLHAAGWHDLRIARAMRMSRASIYAARKRLGLKAHQKPGRPVGWSQLTHGGRKPCRAR